jgi:hypothetical protein
VEGRSQEEDVLISAGLLQSRQPIRRRRGHLASLLVAVSCMANCTPKTPEEQRAEENVAFGRSCASILSARDPKADARTAVAAGDRRLLAFAWGGTDYMAPGIGCSAPYATFQSYGMPELPLNHASNSDDVIDQYEAAMAPCYHANRVYGAAFNLEMARLAPEAVRKSCSVDMSGFLVVSPYADPARETFMFPTEKLSIEQLMPPGTPPAVKWESPGAVLPEAKPTK